MPRYPGLVIHVNSKQNWCFKSKVICKDSWNNSGKHKKDHYIYTDKKTNLDLISNNSTKAYSLFQSNVNYYILIKIVPNTCFEYMVIFSGIEDSLFS